MNKGRILRDIEYINGGITTLKMLCKTDEKSSIYAAYYQLFDEWQDILCSMIDDIEEDERYATHA